MTDWLTVRQERDLVLAAEAPHAEAHDDDTRRRLVDSFLPAITALAHRFPTGIGVERRDLIQQGVAGLLSAARRFDPGRNTPFWAYASFWVRKAMQELSADLTRPVALSDRAVRTLAAIKAARDQHLHDHGDEATTEELIRATGLPRAQIETLHCAERTPCSLDERIDPEWAGGNVGDRIADPAAERAYESVLDGIEHGEVRGLADQLDERERTVIRAHYGLGEPALSFQQIGGALGVTAERVRQIKVRALTKLRAALAQPAWA